jgi:hypothetical protein
LYNKNKLETMRICILCEDSKVQLARQNSKSILAERAEPKQVTPALAAIKQKLGLPAVSEHLGIPLSETGELPATHWFCFMNVTEAGYAKVKSVQEHSIIEESSPKEFLTKNGLKIIKTAQGNEL